MTKAEELEEYQKACKEYDKAEDAFDKAREAYSQAWLKYKCSIGVCAMLADGEVKSE